GPPVNAFCQALSNSSRTDGACRGRGKSTVSCSFRGGWLMVDSGAGGQPTSCECIPARRPPQATIAENVLSLQAAGRVREARGWRQAARKRYDDTGGRSVVCFCILTSDFYQCHAT